MGSELFPVVLSDCRIAVAARGRGGVAGGFGAARAVQPALPDPQMVRQLIANRQARARLFDAELFGDPAWDMLLDLTAAHGEGAQVSVTSLCIAASVPATTAPQQRKKPSGRTSGATA